MAVDGAAVRSKDGRAVDGGGNGGWLGSGGMKKGGTTVAILLGVWGGWFFEVLVLDSESCKAGVRNRGNARLFTTLLFLGHGCLELGGGNESNDGCWTAEVQGRSRKKGRDARRHRRALLPSYGVAVFAQGNRTMILLTKTVRRPDNG